MSDMVFELDRILIENQTLRDERDRYLTALNAWMIYYEQHSTSENRERAYNLTRAALTPTKGVQQHPAFDEYGEHRQPTGLGDL